MSSNIGLKVKQIILFALFLSMAPNSSSERLSEIIKTVTIPGTFEDVREQVIFAVEGQGLVVDDVSDVGAMLDRTGKDLGEQASPLSKAVVLEFCSALYSRRMVDHLPELIAFCPFTISIYTLPEDFNVTRVSFKRIARDLENKKTNSVLLEIDALLERIVEDAAM